MDGHIYIYGIIDGWQDSNSEEWGFNSLKTVKNQVDNQPDAENFTVHIHSEGGLVSEGFAIHDYLKTLGKPITTKIEGLCASIATVIALAGEERVMTQNSDFMIHNPWGFVGGDREDIQRYADELDRLENKIIDFYVNKTGANRDDIQSMMNAETWLDSNKALEFGFITKIETVMRAVAMFNRPDKKGQKSKSKMKNNLTDNDKNWLEGVLAKVFKSKPKNEVTLQDANGVELVFPDVEEGTQVAVGDKATVDGSPAEGEYLMPNGETYVFTAGELTEIKPKEDSGDNTTEEQLQALTEENTQLKATNTSLTNQIAKIKSDLKKEQDVHAELKTDFESLKNELVSKFNLNLDGKGIQNKRDEKTQTSGGSRRLMKSED